VADASAIPLRVLIIEDSEFDARILVNLLRRGGYEPEWVRVETAGALRTELAARPWQLLLADYNLPTFNAPEAIEILHASGLDIPVIIISGGIGEDVAVATMKAGASDYLMKGQLARLVPAVQRELREAEIRDARRKAEQSLRDSEQRYRQIWENATDAVLVLDSGGRVEFANRSATAVFGYDVSELAGRTLDQLRLETGPLSGEPRPITIADLVAAASRRRVVDMAAVGKGGEQIIIEGAASEIGTESDRRTVCFLRDVTERRRNEIELRHRREQSEIVRQIQTRLFPDAAPQVPGFDIAGLSVAAEEAGGDYYDFLPMSQGRMGLVVGDVAGHGVGPALLMAETRAYLRLLVLNRDDVGDILTRASLALADDVDFEHYVTLIFAQLDPSGRTLHYASAGHTKAFIFGADGSIRLELRRTGLALGLKSTYRYATHAPISLLDGDIVLLLTDGVEEAASLSDELFGLERLVHIVRGHRNQPAVRIAEAVRDAVALFRGGVPAQDDLTLIVAKVTDTHAP